MPESYNLTSLRLSKRKSIKANKIEMEAPPYPWGLEINLNKEVLQKLGKKAEDFTVGEDVYILAKANITSKRISENVGSNESVTIGLQVTAMKIQDHGMKNSKNTHKKNIHKKY